ncbi:MAG: Gfo/Idh/MocA family oxidoreductase [Planctomycetes bacterium]|nr:Gfo/Idh/MocA family oxidoreductase [Planctomycetota bacterium]
MALRVGLIGLGGVARWTHLPAMEKMDKEKAQLVAVCDINEKTVAEVAAKYGIEAYTDTRRLLDEARLDAAIVGIPPHLHGDLEDRIIERGIPFYIEKPAHRSIDRAIEIARKVESAGLIAGVGYLDRYQSTVDRMKDFLRDDPCGTFVGFWVGGIYNVPWWIKKDQGGGQHFEQTTHTFDMARYLFGNVREVIARGRTGLNADIPGYEIEDASAATLVFESGLMGTIFSGCFQRTGPGRNGFEIFCRHGKLEFHNRSHLIVRQGQEEHRYPNTVDLALAEDTAFVDAVLQKDIQRMRSPYPDGVKSLALSAAVSDSMATGLPVKPKVVPGPASPGFLTPAR